MSRLNKTKRRIWTVENGQMRRKSDYLATEEPLEIQLRAGGEQRIAAITMRTPGNDYELAAGFLYNEGIIHDKLDIVQMTYCVGSERDLQEYNMLNVTLRTERLPELPELDRHFFTNSACGVCGKTVLEELAKRILPPLPSGPQVNAELLSGLPDTLRQAQNLFESTGGLHAAALFDLTGRLIEVREDVGRHNALDKLIGWAFLNKQLPLHEKIILVSGRASYELLQKCRVAGAPIFCAVSAPSSLAVELAEQFGVTLVGFLRGARFNIYTGVERIALPQPSLAEASLRG
ncbi:MAG: formate dehydrogenase accessory sulfurtransferase FdhD [Caldilineaceae bacterium]